MTGHPRRKWSKPPRIGSGDAPLFFSSLDPQQTKRDEHYQGPRRSEVRTQSAREDDRFDRFYEYNVPPADAVETHFRHSGWSADRKRVGDAMMAANVPESRRWRYWQCGSDCFVEVSDDGQRHRLKANYCGDRFCVPCMVARSRKICEVLEGAVKNTRLRFVTLTRQANDANLSDALDDLRDSFTRLRATRFWQSTVTGGIAFVEITRGAVGRHWHVHMHLLVCGMFIDQRRLSAQWRECSRGSYIVDVRQVADQRRGVAYVAKYATKCLSRSVIDDRDSLVEAILSLRGRRVFCTFGSMRNLKVENDDENQVKWRPVGRLVKIIAAARNGEEWAKGILRSLRLELYSDGSVGTEHPPDEANRAPPAEPPDP